MAGAITALPLLLFVGAARRIRLSTLGLLQYIVPTGHFLIAVYVYGEPLSHIRVATFFCIWIALLIYSLPSLCGRPRA
jgi:chloramphenicol-sensitive protein RarD